MPRNANQSKSANYSLNFDGSNYVDAGTDSVNGALSLQRNFTISFWFFTSSFATTNHIISREDTSTYGWRVQFDSANIALRANSTTQATKYETPIPSTNQWHHLVFTYDGGTNPLCYIDGQSVTLTQGFGTWFAPPNNSYNFRIGKPDSYGGFDGKLGQVSIFDYALSSSQVTTLYGDSTNGSGNPMALPNPPKAYYSLGTSAWNGNFLAENNAIGDYVFDFNPNGNIDTNFTLPNYSDYSYSFWIKNTGSTSGSDQWILGNSSAIVSGDTGSRGAVRINNSTKIRIFGGDDTNYYQKQYDFTAGNAQGNTNIFDGGWYNIVITFTSGTIVFYVNGVAQSQEWNTNTPITGFAANNSYRIGQSGVNTGYLNHSELSNVQIFNTLLSQPDAETLYNYGSPIQTLANIPQNSNLKAWYKLDASEIYDSSITEWEVENNANPSVYTQSTKLNGNSGSRIYLNPNTGNSTGGIILPNSFSFSFWINTVSTINGPYSGGSVIEGSGAVNPSGGSLWNIFRYSHFSSGKWTLMLHSSQGSTTGNAQVTTVINDGRWHHVLLTYDSSSTTLTVYTDNVQTYTLSTNNFGTGINVPRIGTSYDGNASSVFTGDLSNLSFWTSALTSSQINEIYNNGTPKDLSTNSNYSNLLNWYKLDNDLQDSKGSNNGTGGSTTTKTFGFINTLAGESSGMSQSNLVQSDLQTVAPYSKYSLSFDGTNDYIDCGNDSSLKLTSNFSISVWMKSSNQQSFAVAVGNNGVFSLQMSATLNKFRFNVYSSGWQEAYYSLNPIDDDKWHHVVATHDGSTIKVYVDNVKGTDASAGAIPSNTAPFLIGYLPGNAGLYFDGQISNVSYWNTALTQAQVTETYNEGLPGNLNSHSAYSNLVSWWQLGSNSSWNGNRWIVADGKGTNNGYSQNMAPYMPESGLTNGVGTTANGVSDSMGVGALVSDAPYSTGNAMSVNMAATARGTDVP